MKLNNKSILWLFVTLIALVGGYFAGKILNKKESQYGFINSVDTIPSNYKLTNLDYINFYKADEQTKMVDRSRLPLNIFSAQIPVNKAKSEHFAYLNSAQLIYHGNSGNNQEAIRSFFITNTEFNYLHANMKAGVRVYLGLVNDSLNLVLVPTDNSMVNIPGINYVNTLDPCPDKCSKGIGLTKNDPNDLNYSDKQTDAAKWRAPRRKDNATGKSWNNNENTASVTKGSGEQ